jgi:hypothetical protein
MRSKIEGQEKLPNPGGDGERYDGHHRWILWRRYNIPDFSSRRPGMAMATSHDHPRLSPALPSGFDGSNVSTVIESLAQGGESDSSTKGMLSCPEQN